MKMSQNKINSLALCIDINFIHQDEEARGTNKVIDQQKANVG